MTKTLAQVQDDFLNSMVGRWAHVRTGDGTIKTVILTHVGLLNVTWIDPKNPHCPGLSDVERVTLLESCAPAWSPDSTPLSLSSVHAMQTSCVRE